MKFSLVIPCYNEEKIPLLLRKYRKFLSDKKNELILVNNGSTDRTKKVINKISQNKKYYWSFNKKKYWFWKWFIKRI